MTQQQPVVVGLGCGGLGTEVEESALPSVDPPAQDFGPVRADGQNWIGGRDVVARLLLGGVLEPGVVVQEVIPLDLVGDPAAHPVDYPSGARPLREHMFAKG